MSDKDNLELYLNDVFQKECEFKIDQEEVDFIRTGIENLVERIVDDVSDKLSRHTDKFVRNLRDPEIIKVGSFYEGTKNGFPDEFDIIFCFHELKKEEGFTYVLETDIIKDVCDKNRRVLRYLCKSKSKQRIEFEKYLEKHGPATWLRFIYTNKAGKKKRINVDLVPAGRMILTVREQAIAASEICQVEPFRREILLTGSFLIIEGNYSFTDTEAHFMKNRLSSNHRKVYRILKQLINGYSTEDVYKDKTMSFYTSHVIKSVMIIHHYRCTRTADFVLGPCLLEVLDQLLTYEYDPQIPRLVARPLSGETLVPYFTSEFFLKKYLRNLTMKLKSMRSSEHAYDYNAVRVEKSLLEQYLNENGKSDMDFDFRICSIV